MSNNNLNLDIGILLEDLEIPQDLRTELYEDCVSIIQDYLTEESFKYKGETE